MTVVAGEAAGGIERDVTSSAAAAAVNE